MIIIYIATFIFLLLIFLWIIILPKYIIKHKHHFNKFSLNNQLRKREMYKLLKDEIKKIRRKRKK